MAEQSNKNINEIVSVLQELGSDNTVPKNIKLKIGKIITDLESSEDEISIRINKALNILDEVSDDNNIQAYTRTQIWNVVSMLEAIKN